MPGPDLAPAIADLLGGDGRGFDVRVVPAPAPVARRR